MKKNKSKTDYTRRDENGLYKPMIKIKNKTVRAEYFYDGSGEIEVLRKGKQIYCREDAKAKDHLASLKTEIIKRQDDIEALNGHIIISMYHWWASNLLRKDKMTKLIDIDKWHNDFATDAGYDLPTEPDCKNMEKIGVLRHGNKTIKFVIDFDFIYANGKVIESTYNDRHTAKPVFTNMMKNIYGNRFIETK